MLALADTEGLAVASRGGGTQLALGNHLERLDVVVDMSALNRVVQHNAADLTLAVEAGITLATLRETPGGGRAISRIGRSLCLNAPRLAARSLQGSADR